MNAWCPRLLVGTLLILLLCLLFPAVGRADPQPTARTTVNQNVRAMGHLGAPILEVLQPGATVTLHARLQDGSWVDVTTPHKVKGWMYRRYLQVDDTVVMGLPAVGQDYLLDMLPQSDAMPGMTQATPAPPGPTAKPTSTPDPLAAMNTFSIVELPAGLVTDARALIPITVTVCIDLNQNRTCDPGEGIRDVPILVADATTAQVLATKATDAQGQVTLAVLAPDQAQLTVSAPTLAWTEAVFGSADRPPAALQHIEPQGSMVLPWPLP
jgi:hypothetical protein